MEEVELIIDNLDYPQPQSEAFTLQLKEKNGTKFIPIVIGVNEAKTIIMEAHHIKMRRPFAHDLFIQLCELTGCTIHKILIHGFHEGIYDVKIELFCDDIPAAIESRVSDAVVIALKKNVPIFMINRVLEDNCQEKRTLTNLQNEPIWEVSQDDFQDGVDFFLVQPQMENENLADLSLDILESMLNQAVETENFEMAAKINDEIIRRNSHEE